MPGHHPLQEIIPCVAQVVPHSAEDLVNLSCNLKTFALHKSKKSFNLTAYPVA